MKKAITPGTRTDKYKGLIIYGKGEEAENIILSTHCHNDLGMAVANSLAAIRSGARQVEGTINGIGERAGNVALEEIVMAIRTREDQLPFYTGIKSQEIYKTSKLLSTLTGLVAYNPALSKRPSLNQ